MNSNKNAASGREQPHSSGGRHGQNRGYGSIPGISFERITFLARALPVCSVPTFIELLIGTMLTQTGFVTGACGTSGDEMGIHRKSH